MNSNSSSIAEGAKSFFSSNKLLTILLIIVILLLLVYLFTRLGYSIKKEFYFFKFERNLDID